MVEKHEGGPPLTGYHRDSSHATRNSTRHAALALALWRTRRTDSVQMMATLGCITVTVLTIVIISIVKNAGG